MSITLSIKKRSKHSIPDWSSTIKTLNLEILRCFILETFENFEGLETDPLSDYIVKYGEMLSQPTILKQAHHDVVIAL